MLLLYLCILLNNAIKEIKSSETTREFIESLKNLIKDSQEILINEYNRCTKKHREMIKEQQRKFMFQMSFKFEFDEEIYDKWNQVTLACPSDWYDLKNEIHNKEILAEYARNKYRNYFRKIILAPTLSVIGPVSTRVVRVDMASMDGYSMSSSFTM